MGLTATKFPTAVAAASSTPYDDIAWGGAVTRLTADDASYASITASSFDTNVISYLVKCQHFDFAVPTDATIYGLVVTAQGYYATSNFTLNHIKLLNASGTAEGDDKYATPSGAFGTGVTDVTWGSATDMWGVSLTPSMVNDDDFGVEFAIKASGNNSDAYLDYLKITIYYMSPMTTTGATASIVAANAILLRNRSLISQAATVSLSATTTPSAWIFKPYSSILCGLTSSSLTVDVEAGEVITELETTSSAASLVTSDSVTLLKHAVALTTAAIGFSATFSNARLFPHLRSNAAGASLTTTDSSLTKSHAYSLITEVSASSLLASDAILQKAYTMVTTSGGAILTASDAIVGKAYSMVTIEAGFALGIGDSVATKQTKLCTNVSAASMVTSDALATKSHTIITTAAGASLIADNAVSTKVHSATTNAGGFSLVAGDAIALKSHNTLTTSASASLTASDVFATTSGAISLTTTTAAASLTASNAASLRATKLTTTSVAASLLTSSTELANETGTIPLLTVASTASLTTTTVVTRYSYCIYGTVAANLTTSSSSLTASSVVPLTTTASAASLSITTAQYALDRTTYTYAIATSSRLDSASLYLRKGMKWLITTPSGTTLKTDSLILLRMMRTTSAASSLITSNSASTLTRYLKVTSSSAKLTTSPSGVSVFNSGYPATKYLSTTTSQFRLSASSYQHAMLRYINPFLRVAPEGYAGHAETIAPTNNIYSSGTFYYFSKFTLTENGLASSMGINLANLNYYPGYTPGENNIRGLIYSDNSGIPYRFVGVSNEVVVEPYFRGTKILTFSPQVVISSGDYWVGVQSSGTGDYHTGGLSITLVALAEEEDEWGILQGGGTDPWVTLLWGEDPPEEFPIYNAVPVSLGKIHAYIVYRANFNLTASPTGLFKESSGVLPIIRLYTIVSGGTLDTGNTPLGRTMVAETTSGGAALTTSSSVLVKAYPMPTSSAGAALDSSPATLAVPRWMYSIGSGGSLTISRSVLKRKKHIHFAHGGWHSGERAEERNHVIIRNHAILGVDDTTNRPKKKGAKVCQ